MLCKCLGSPQAFVLPPINNGYTRSVFLGAETFRAVDITTQKLKLELDYWGQNRVKDTIRFFGSSRSL